MDRATPGVSGSTSTSCRTSYHDGGVQPLQKRHARVQRLPRKSSSRASLRPHLGDLVPRSRRAGEELDDLSWMKVVESTGPLHDETSRAARCSPAATRRHRRRNVAAVQVTMAVRRGSVATPDHAELDCRHDEGYLARGKMPRLDTCCRPARVMRAAIAAGPPRERNAEHGTSKGNAPVDAAGFRPRREMISAASSHDFGPSMMHGGPPIPFDLR